MGIVSTVGSVLRRLIPNSVRSAPIVEVPAVTRTDIVLALNDLVAHQEGFRFQSLAVILAKKRWPALIASEWSWDLGVDAYAPSAGAAPAMALAASTTASLKKVKADLARIRETHPEVQLLVFYTPGKVTKHTAEQWQRELSDSGDDVHLIVVSREDIISSLLAPENAALCSSHLRLTIPVRPEVRDKLADAQDAVRATIGNWLATPRLSGAPLIALPLMSPDWDSGDSPAVVDLNAIADRLRLGQRVRLTGAGGSGKTTTAIQLADLLADQGDLCLLIDIPQWITSDSTALEYVSRSQPFLARAVTARDLARLSDGHHITWLMNGWNELAEKDRSDAAARLISLDRDFPGAGVLIAARSGVVSAPIAFSARVEIQPLTSEQRHQYLTQVLGDRAPALSEIIGGSPTLDSLTRVPLLLSEVAELHECGLPIPESTFGILTAMAARLEAAEQHRAFLADGPINGKAAEYLSALAVSATGRGASLITDVEARRVVSEVADQLVDQGQLAARPDPGSVVERLCAHHCLQRLDGSEHPIRFQHQRFQEYYAARWIAGLLARAEDQNALAAVETDILNWPFYASSIEMVAEAVGLGSDDLGGPGERTRIGERLATASFAVDPVFGGSVARLCGETVWSRVGARMGQHLRRLFTTPDPRTRRYALAAMLATGSPDFLDVVEPLLLDDDAQIRLGAFRALGSFHVTTLGFDWIERISAWPESTRIEFVTEAEWLNGSPEIAEEVLQRDESVAVRGAALHWLLLGAAPEALERNQEAIDDAVIDEALRIGGAGDWYPPAWNERIAARIAASLERTVDSATRIRLLLRLSKFRRTEATEALKAELKALPEEVPGGPLRYVLGEALSLIQSADQDWINDWISERVARGTLWEDPWIGRVTAITTDLRDRLIEQLTSVHDEERRERSAIALLAKFADAHASEVVLRTMYRLEDEALESEGVARTKERASTQRRLRDLAVALTPRVLADAILATTSEPPRAAEIRVALDVLSRAGEHVTDFGEDMPPDLRNRLRGFLLQLERPVLAEPDYAGSLKAEFALAVGRVGSPEDVGLLERLIRADIDRVRVGLAARIRGERSAAADGAVIRWSTWHLRALVGLGETAALPLLLDLLEEPEYEVDAAKALATQVLGITPVDQLLPVVLREQKQASVPPPEDLQVKCTEAIATRLRILLDQHRTGPDDAVEHRMKELAAVLAIADRGEARDLILEVVALPSQWDMWQRTVALERMAASGEPLPTGATLAVVNSVVDRIIEIGIHDQQVQGLSVRLLRVLPFLEDPGPGFDRMREFLKAHPLRGHQLEGLIAALGRSKSDDALDVLVQLSGAALGECHSSGGEWVRAVGSVGTPRAKRLLLSFVDPEGEPRPGIASRGASNALELEIAALAEDSHDVSTRLLELCARDLGENRRSLLAAVMGRIGTQEAVMESLLLIHDDDEPAALYAVEHSLEHFLVERRPHETLQNAQSLVPRAGGEIRRRLFEFWLADDGRKAAAEQLLKVIDEWRLEYGKPPAEPRHPAIESGVPWPPLTKRIDQCRA